MHADTQRLTFRDSQLETNRAQERRGDGSLRAGKIGQNTEGTKGKMGGLGEQRALVRLL